MRGLVQSALHSSPQLLPTLVSKIQTPIQPIVMASVLRRSRRIIACDSIKSRPLVYSSANDLHNDLIHRSAWAVGFLSGIDFTGTAPAVHTPPPEGAMSRVIVDASLQEPLARLLTIFIGWFVAACELPVVVDDATHRVFMAKLVDLQKPAGQELLKEIIRVGRCAGKFPQLHLVLETVCRECTGSYLLQTTGQACTALVLAFFETTFDLTQSLKTFLTALLPRH